MAGDLKSQRDGMQVFYESVLIIEEIVVEEEGKS